jgi:hypothetical protein
MSSSTTAASPSRSSSSSSSSTTISLGQHLLLLLLLLLEHITSQHCAVARTPLRTRFLPDDPKLQFSGRFLPVQIAGQAAVAFDHPGTEVRMRVTSTTSVNIQLRQQRSPPTKIGHRTYPSFQADYFVVLVNGTVVAGFANATFSTATCNNRTSTSIAAVQNLDPSNIYDIRIFKSSEAQWAASVPSPNWLTLTSIVLERTDHPIVAFDESPLPTLLQLPAWRSRRLEFIGDSLMAGYCNLLWVPDIHRHKTNRSNLESFFLSWPTRTCELLGAECHTAAWSGFALTHSHFCNKPVTMPQIWKRTLATASTSDWNFSTWTPAAVVINLGTVRLQALASNNNELIVLCPNKLNACMPRCRTIGMGCLQTGARLRCLNLSPISRTHFMTLWSTSLLQLCMVLRRRSSSLSGQ